MITQHFDILFCCVCAFC